MKIVRLDLQLPEKLPALLCAVQQYANDGQAVIGGGFLRALYFIQHRGIEAAITDIDVFAKASNLPMGCFSCFGRPYIRMDLSINGGPSRSRHDFAADPSQVWSDKLQINVSAEGEKSTIQGYLESVNLTVNAIVYDGEAVWASREFVADCRDKVLRFNARRLQLLEPGLAYNDYERTLKKVEDYKKRPEFSGFGLVEIDDYLQSFGPPVAQGAFWRK